MHWPGGVPQLVERVDDGTATADPPRRWSQTKRAAEAGVFYL